MLYFCIFVSGFYWVLKEIAYRVYQKNNTPAEVVGATIIALLAIEFVPRRLNYFIFALEIIIPLAIYTPKLAFYGVAFMSAVVILLSQSIDTIGMFGVVVVNALLFINHKTRHID